MNIIHQILGKDISTFFVYRLFPFRFIEGIIFGALLLMLITLFTFVFPSLEAFLGILLGCTAVCIFIYAMFGWEIFVRLPSEIEKEKKVRNSYYCKFKSNYGFPSELCRNTNARMLSYDDGLELRVFYSVYFVPFEKIDKISLERNKFTKNGIIIKITEHNVTSDITFYHRYAEDIFQFISSNLGN
jgi:hypothetical protein